MLVGAILGSWETMVDLIGTRLLLAAIVAAIVMAIVGYLASTGRPETKQASSLIQICSNSGPAFAAVGIAFSNDSEILGAMTAVLALQIVVGLGLASFQSKNAGESDAGSAKPATATTSVGEAGAR